MRKDKRILQNTTTPPQGLTYLCAFIVTVLISMGFPWMVGSAFKLNVEPISLFFSSLFVTAVFAGIHTIDKKWLSVAVLIVTPLLVILSINADLFLTKTGLETFMHYVRFYAMFNLPDVFRNTPAGREAIATVLETINIIPINILTYVIIKRKGVLIPLILYIPYFFLAVANMGMVPSQSSVVVTLSGVILLFFVHLMRHKERSVSDKSLLLLTGPVLLVTVITGLFFPMDDYHKYELAEEALINIQATVAKLDRTSDGRITKFIDVLINGRTNEESISEAMAIRYDSICATSTDLSTTGPFNPPSYKLFTVYKSANSSYAGTAEYYSGGYMYLKLNSMDTYEDNLWSMEDFDMDPYSRDYTPSPQTAQYTVTLTLPEENDVDIVPMYTDFYIVQGSHDTYTQINPYNYSDDEQTVFFNSPVPLRTGNIYSDSYLDDYVYDTTLEVPEETRDALLDSGLLPDWYIEAYNGESTMSDADKVRGVTDFVRSLHPYDKFTSYPPADEDFVVWFVTEADSGICVHYASTSVILLRMLGIPARYVEGFLDSEAGSNKESDIYTTEAHAWFEFFDPEFGWILGDPTPGNAVIASNFDINAVARAYPEIETDVFSVTSGNHPVSPDPTTPADPSDPTDTTDPQTTDSTDSGDATTSTDVSDPTDQTTAPTTSPSTSGTSDITPAAPAHIFPDHTTPDPTDTTTPAGTEPDETEPSHILDPEENERPNRRHHKNYISYTDIMNTAISALIVFTGFALIRIIYVLSWKIRFMTKDNRKKAVAYYHYFSFMSKILGTKLPKKAVGVAQKAAFSNEEISDEEIKLLVSTSTESAKALSEKLPLYRRVPYRFFEITV